MYANKKTEKRYVQFLVVRTDFIFIRLNLDEWKWPK